MTIGQPIFPRVALTGLTGVGKSEAAKFLANEYGFQMCQTGLVCRQVSQLLFLDESKAHLTAVSDALKNIEPDILITVALRGKDMQQRLVIDAIRYHGDLEFAHQNGFRTVRIVASDRDRSRWLAARGQLFDFDSDGEHASEKELSAASTDITVDNAGSVNDLYKLMRAAIS